MNYQTIYLNLMNSRPLEQITSDWNKPIPTGSLIGFKGLGKDGPITAAYPVWRVVGNEIQFILYYSLSSGVPVLDNTWFTSQLLFINDEPIFVGVDPKEPTTFGKELAKMFNT